MGRPKKLTPNIEKAPQRLVGGFDLMPEQYLSWEAFWEKLVGLAHVFNYSQVQVPFFEDARLFRQWGQNGATLASLPMGKIVAALTPTPLFGLSRTYLAQQAIEEARAVKWFYLSPIAQITEKGELKQNYEFGFQIFGPLSPIADAQMVNLAFRLFQQVGLTELSLDINNAGCIECQPGYQEALKQYFKDKKYDLCENCLNHLEEGKPMQILACSNLSCNAAASDAPPIMDMLCETCRNQFIGVLEGLDELGIGYNLNPRVIGKPWSRRTVFEIHGRVGEHDMLLGSGGHADEMIQSLGGQPACSLNFSSTQETILKALEVAGIKFASKHKTEVFLVPLGDLAAKKSLGLFTDLWSQDIIASEFTATCSIKTQLKMAESAKAAIALIIGQKEAREGTVILRDVKSGMQELFAMDRIIEEVKKRLGK